MSIGSRFPVVVSILTAKIASAASTESCDRRDAGSKTEAGSSRPVASQSLQGSVDERHLLDSPLDICHLAGDLASWPRKEVVGDVELKNLMQTCINERLTYPGEFRQELLGCDVNTARLVPSASQCTAIRRSRARA